MTTLFKFNVITYIYILISIGILYIAQGFFDEWMILISNLLIIFVMVTISIKLFVFTDNLFINTTKWFIVLIICLLLLNILFSPVIYNSNGSEGIEAANQAISGSASIHSDKTATIQATLSDSAVKSLSNSISYSAGAMGTGVSMGAAWKAGAVLMKGSSLPPTAKLVITGLSAAATGVVASNLPSLSNYQRSQPSNSGQSSQNNSSTPSDSYTASSMNEDFNLEVSNWLHAILSLELILVVMLLILTLLFSVFFFLKKSQDDHQENFVTRWMKKYPRLKTLLNWNSKALLVNIWVTIIGLWYVLSITIGLIISYIVHIGNTTSL